MINLYKIIEFLSIMKERRIIVERTYIEKLLNNLNEKYGFNLKFSENFKNAFSHSSYTNEKRIAKHLKLVSFFLFLYFNTPDASSIIARRSTGLDEIISSTLP